MNTQDSGVATQPKKKRGRPVGSGTGATSLRGKIFEIIKEGESVTFTRLGSLEDPADTSNFVHEIGSYASRRQPGVSFTYESFEAITAQRKLIVGVILTHCGEREGES